MKRLVSAAFAVLALSSSAGAAATEVTVAVAANFIAPMQKIAAAFEHATGHRAVLASGSTGSFNAQIRNGAPFQVLLAADVQTPARLEGEGFAVPGSRFTYATGRLVLWSAQPGRVDARGEALSRLAANERVAIADPKLAPYGSAAVETLERLGIRERVRDRVVQGENVAQAYQYVSTGNAAMGFVALSQVMSDGRIAKGSAWIVPAGLHTPIRQDAVLLTPGKGNAAAVSLLSFLRSDEAKAIIRGFGYGA